MFPLHTLHLKRLHFWHLQQHQEHTQRWWDQSEELKHLTFKRSSHIFFCCHAQFNFRDILNVALHLNLKACAYRVVGANNQHPNLWVSVIVECVHQWSWCQHWSRCQGYRSSRGDTTSDMRWHILHCKIRLAIQIEFYCHQPPHFCLYQRNMLLCLLGPYYSFLIRVSLLATDVVIEASGW